MINWNTNGDYPQVNDTACIHPTAVIIGNIKIGKNVFVGPGAVIRADESGSSITVQDNCNIQDRVVIHALEASSVLIKENTSLAHGCIVHGPCKIGKDSFVGFGSVVFNADIDEGVCIKHLAVVEGVTVQSEKIIESHSLIDCKEDVLKLRRTDKKHKKFMEKVVEVNLSFAKGYNNEQSGFFR